MNNSHHGKDAAHPIPYMQDPRTGEMISYPESGLTKREYAAIHILGSLQLAYDYKTGPCNEIAIERAVILADMLLVELNKPVESEEAKKAREETEKEAALKRKIHLLQEDIRQKQDELSRILSS